MTLANNWIHQTTSSKEQATSPDKGLVCLGILTFFMFFQKFGASGNTSFSQLSASGRAITCSVLRDITCPIP